MSKTSDHFLPDVEKADFIREMERADRERPLVIHIERFEMFCVVAAVQLAMRHPLYTGPSRQVVESVLRQIQEQFPPLARSLIERGWDQGQDEIITSS